eukprot:403344064
MGSAALKSEQYIRTMIKTDNRMIRGNSRPHFFKPKGFDGNSQISFDKQLNLQEEDQHHGDSSKPSKELDFGFFVEKENLSPTQVGLIERDYTELLTGGTVEEEEKLSFGGKDIQDQMSGRVFAQMAAADKKEALFEESKVDQKLSIVKQIQEKTVRINAVAKNGKFVAPDSNAQESIKLPVQARDDYSGGQPIIKDKRSFDIKGYEKPQNCHSDIPASNQKDQDIIGRYGREEEGILKLGLARCRIRWCRKQYYNQTRKHRTQNFSLQRKS